MTSITDPQAASYRAPQTVAQALPLRDDLRKTRLMGQVGMLALLAILTLWSTVTMISGAVIASGQAVVRGKAQLVQTLDGGVVASIAVKDGDHVVAGQILMTLDPTLLTVNLDIARGRLAEALARKARLEAEQLGLAAPVFDYPALPFGALDTAQHEEGQRQIFQARADVLRGRRDQLAEKLVQLETQITGVEGQIAAKRDQLVFVEKDLVDVIKLNEQGLVRQSQLSDLQRSQSEILGQLAALEADLSHTRAARGDSELETLQGERAFKEEVVTELRTVTTEVEELMMEIVTRTEQLDRIDLRAPADGVVHQMQATTVGGVVAPGATILEVVPTGRGVDFEVRIDTRTVDQVFPGQVAQVIVSAFNSRTTPKLDGVVASVSPGAITDPVTGQTYYQVGLTVSPEELARLGDVVLVPGMPVEAFLQTGDRSVMSYLLEPLTSQFRYAFREE
jgi:HlyD family secretion protein